MTSDSSSAAVQVPGHVDNPQGAPCAEAPKEGQGVPALIPEEWAAFGAEVVKPTTPGSADVIVAAMESKFNELSKNDAMAPIVPPTSQAATEESEGSKEDAQLGEVNEAIRKGGTFNMQLGECKNLWQQALKDHPELKEQFKALGRGYTQQRQFKLQWLEKTKTHLETVAKRIQQQVSSDSVDGIYLPISRIYKEEGKDQAAMTATRNYVNHAVAMYRTGKQVGGRPMILWNSMTERNEFLYLKRTCRDQMLDMHILEDTWRQKQARKTR